MKGADYMSAVSEIWRQFKAGTRDDSFVKAMNNHKKKFESGSAELTDSTEKLLTEMLDFMRRLDL